MATPIYTFKDTSQRTYPLWFQDLITKKTTQQRPSHAGYHLIRNINYTIPWQEQADRVLDETAELEAYHLLHNTLEPFCAGPTMFFPINKKSPFQQQEQNQIQSSNSDEQHQQHEKSPLEYPTQSKDVCTIDNNGNNNNNQNNYNSLVANKFTNNNNNNNQTNDLPPSSSSIDNRAYIQNTWLNTTTATLQKLQRKYLPPRMTLKERLKHMFFQQWRHEVDIYIPNQIAPTTFGMNMGYNDNHVNTDNNNSNNDIDNLNSNNLYSNAPPQNQHISNDKLPVALCVHGGGFMRGFAVSDR
eukprot:UN04595